MNWLWNVCNISLHERVELIIREAHDLHIVMSDFKSV